MDSFKDFAEMVVRICKHPDTDCMHCRLPMILGARTEIF